MKYKYIAWDFDGTLYDSYPHIIGAMKKAIEVFGYTDRVERIIRTRLKRRNFGIFRLILIARHKALPLRLHRKLLKIPSLSGF